MKLIYSRLAYEKIQYFVHRTQEEISGFGIVELVEGVPYVTDVILLEQINHSTETEIDALAICKAETYMLENNIKGEIKNWWHSHNSMPTEWSQTDYNTIDMLSKHGWFTATVFNNKGESRSCFSDGTPTSDLAFDYTVFHDDIELVIFDNIPQSVFEQCEKEYKEKVKEVKFGQVEIAKEGVSLGGHAQETWSDAKNEYTGSIHKDYWLDENWSNEWEIVDWTCTACSYEFTGDYSTFKCPKCSSPHIADEEDLADMLLDEINGTQK